MCGYSCLTDINVFAADDDSDVEPSGDDGVEFEREMERYCHFDILTEAAVQL